MAHWAESMENWSEDIEMWQLELDYARYGDIAICGGLIIFQLLDGTSLDSRDALLHFADQGCISCGILVSGIGARGVSSEHMENMEMFSLSPT